MLSAVLIDYDKNSTSVVLEKLHSTCPEIKIQGTTLSYSEAPTLITDVNPDLIFVDARDGVGKLVGKLYRDQGAHCVSIFFSDVKDYTIYAMRCHASAYILKPIQDVELIAAVDCAKIRIEERRELVESKKLVKRLMVETENDIIGIPTIEGYEFVSAQRVVRCEALQKCTRVLTVDKTDIISSYSIGEFRKILERFGFFLPHKSHLINLRFINKFYKDGTLLMRDGSLVPVARRRKIEFLKRIPHV